MAAEEPFGERTLQRSEAEDVVGVLPKHELDKAVAEPAKPVREQDSAAHQIACSLPPNAAP